MGDQLAFPLGPEPHPTERTTLARLPEKPYTPPKLVPRPPSLIEILNREKSPPERAAESTGLSVEVATKAWGLLETWRIMFGEAEERVGSQAWWQASWDVLGQAIGAEQAEKYARYEARYGGALACFVQDWIDTRAVH